MIKTTLLIMIIAGAAYGAPPDKTPTLEAFLAAPTGPAQHMLTKFSDEQLQQLFEKYKAGKSNAEKRHLWLVEEYQKRQGNRIAEERLVYLFAAVILLLALIIGFLLVLVMQQRRLARELGDDQV